MNLTKNLQFEVEKPAILSLLRGEHVKAFVIGLLKDQVLEKHRTAVPALLIVLEGAIMFKIKSQVLLLAKQDVYTIPVGIEHEVIGNAERNSFLIIKG